MTEAQGTLPTGPAGLRLRADPPRVMRLSRKALAIAGAVATTAVAGALIYALQPRATNMPSELHDVEHRGVGDSLAGAPKDYAQVPRLGPPLPGDLGRPILSAQQRGADVDPPPIGARPVPSSGVEANATQAVRDRVREERDAARTSKLFATNGSASASRGLQPVQQDQGDRPPPALRVASGSPTRDSTGSERSLGLGAEAQRIAEHRIAPAASAFTVQAGSVIPAALITGIRSDLPGLITAQVTSPVYDSVSGSHLLIPQGSRLVGEYESQVSAGQTRVLLAWTRLIFPDGRAMVLDRLPSADLSGYSGLQDRVDHHWGGMLRAALVSTLLSVGAQAGSGEDDKLVRALRQGSSDTVARSGQELVRRQLNVRPTLTIRAGMQLRVLVTRDLILEPEGSVQ